MFPIYEPTFTANMLAKKFIYYILIITLALQLFPTTQAGQFYIVELPEEECSDAPGAKGNPLRQINEEEYKDIHIEHNWIAVPMMNLNNAIFNFPVSLPEPHPGTIHTPPPNVCLA